MFHCFCLARIQLRYLVTCNPEKHKTLMNDDQVKACMKSFIEQFEKNQSAATHGRAQQKVDDDSMEAWDERIRELVDPEVMWNTKSDQCQLPCEVCERFGLIVPKLFGICRNKSTRAIETGMVPSFRLQLQGVREVVCAKVSHVREISGKEDLTAAKAKEIFACMTKDIRITR